MGEVYHGSSQHNLKVIEARSSTHRKYAYATKDKVLATHFSKRCGDDAVYDIGMFSSDENFRDIQTGFDEVVSENDEVVIDEEIIDDLYTKMMNIQKEGLLKIYRYPNKPNGYKNSIIDKYRHYISKLHKNFDKCEFDRIVYLHPEIISEIDIIYEEYNERKNTYGKTSKVY